MSNLDQKRSIIEGLLIKLREFNPNIGVYEKSVLTDTLTYAVKLSNGRLEIPKEIVEDFEISPSFISDHHIRELSNNFQFNSESIEASPIKQTNEPVPPSRRKIKLQKTIPFLIIGVLLLIGYLIYLQIERQKVASQREEKAIVREEKTEARADEEYQMKSEEQAKESKLKDERKKEEDKKKHIRNNIHSYISATPNNYEYNNLGGIYNLEITVWNNTDYLLNNVKVRVQFLKPNGEVWNNRDLDFSLIPANDFLTLRTADTERGVSVRLQVLDVKSEELNL